MNTSVALDKYDTTWISSHDEVLRNAAMTASAKVTSGAGAFENSTFGFIPLALGVDPRPPLFLLRHVLRCCVILPQSSQTTDDYVSGC